MANTGRFKFDLGYELGKAAHAAGKVRVPIQDRALVARLIPGPLGINAEIYQGWLRGWDEANLAPVTLTSAQVVSLLSTLESAVDLIECNCGGWCDGSCTHSELERAIKLLRGGK